MPSAEGVFGFDCERIALLRPVVLAMRGRERISSPFRFDVDLRIDRDATRDVPNELVGSSATLWLRASPPDRPVHGLIASATREPGTEHDLVRVALVPHVFLLRRTKQSRVFQGMSAPDVVRQVLEQRRIPVRSLLTQTYAIRDLCVQYMETELSFCERLLAEEGIFYFFDHEGTEGRETLCLADDPSGLPPIPGTALPFRPSAGMNERRDDVTSFLRGRRTTSTRAVLREFDFERPSFVLEATAKHDGDERHDLEVYEHHGEHGGLDVRPEAATRRLEQARARSAWGEGTSRCARMQAGLTFELAECPIAEYDGHYTLVEVAHTGRTPEGETTLAPVYENRFVCVPKSVAPRPRARRRKVQEPLLTATVVGPAGQEIHTDQYGRIRVQFHWDRDGRRDEKSSCWVRVAQTWSGVGWGFQFIPRIGMEVLVAFVGGDLDRPLVVGAVPNAEHPVPFPLPASKTKSGIRTQTSRGGGGFHELSFEDRAGYERVYLRSQRDLDEEVLHDRNEQIGGSLTSQVAENRVARTQGDEFSVVEKNAVRAVGGDSTLTVAGSERRVTEGDVDVRIAGVARRRVDGKAREEVAGARLVAVGGAAEDQVGGDQTVWVGGSRSSSVKGGDHDVIGGDSTRHVLGRSDVSVRSGASLTVGESVDATELRASADGRATLRAARTLDVEVQEAIRVRVGKSTITIGPESIVIDSESIRLDGREVKLVTGKASLVLEKDAELVAEKVRLSSRSKSLLELSDAARLDGPRVHLASGQAAEAEARKKREAEEPRAPVRTVRLFDHTGEPCVGARYEISLPGWTRSGNARDGTITIPAFPNVETCVVRWGASSGEGLEYEATIFLEEEGPDPDETARRKLWNLGHRRPSLHEAVASFQAYKGVETTANVEDARGSIDAAHAEAKPVEAKRGS